MDQTNNLNLPYIMPQQAQKHVTHNEALRDLDTIVQLAALDRDLAAPPASPAPGGPLSRRHRRQRRLDRARGRHRCIPGRGVVVLSAADGLVRLGR